MVWAASRRNDADPGRLAGPRLPPNHDLDVLIERRQQVHQALDGEAGKLVVPKSGNLWLAHPEHLRGFRLRVAARRFKR
jgi:hypothetical protein